MRVLYVPPPQPPSPVPEESEEGSSPRPSVSDNGNWSAAELSSVSYFVYVFLGLVIYVVGNSCDYDILSQVPRGHAENEEKDPEVSYQWTQ